MRVKDWIGEGYWSLRHHVPKDHDLALRNVPKIVRTATRDLGLTSGRNEFGILEPEDDENGGEEKSVGDLNCATFWTHDKDAEESRELSGWAFAWPASVSTPPPDDEEELGAPRTQARPGSGQEKTKGDGSKARPIRTSDWDRDKRFKEKKVAPPVGLGGFPKGFPGLVVAGVEERSQDDLFLPAGGALVAPHLGGRANLGSLVFDVTDELELDPKRKARLQSLTRVYAIPPSCAQAALGKAGGHALALQLGRPRKGFPGLGMFADEFPGTGSALGGLQTVSGGAKPVQVLSPLSHRLNGPLHPGFGAQDLHAFGTNEDGDQFSVGGISTNAYFVAAPGISGPLPFGGRWRQGTDWAIDTNVYLEWDPNDVHGFFCGPRPGRWKLRTTVPLYSPPPPWEGFPIPVGDPSTPPGIPTNYPSTPPRTGEPSTPPNTGTPTTVGRPRIVIGEPSTPSNPGGGVTVGGGFDIPVDGPVFDPTDPGALIEELERRNRGGDDGLVNDVIRRNDPTARENPIALRVLASWQEFMAPAVVVRAQHLNPTIPDLRNQRYPTRAQLAALDRSAPAIARLEGIGHQVGDSWDYTTPPGAGRYAGGTARGTYNVLPPEIGAEQILDGTEPATVSETFLNLYRAAFALSKPTADGGIQDGFAFWRSDDGLTLTIDGYDGNGDVDADPPLEIDRDAQEVRAFGVPLGGGGGGGTTETPGWAGCGGDGAFDLDGTNTYPSHFTKSGSTYTQIADVAATTFDVAVGVTVKTNGYRIYAKESITNAGTIRHNGNDGDVGALGGGGAGAPSGSCGGNGGNGGAAGSNGVIATPNTSCVGGNGGAGTNFASGGSAGNGGNGSGGFNNVRGTYRKYSVASSGCFDGGSPSSNSPVAGGSGGGGGSNAAGTKAGGGGGGGVMVLVSPEITNTGTIQANGGAGGNPGTDDGGGGGGGGVVFLVYWTLTNSGTIEAVGGAAGSAHAQGGAAGKVVECTPP